MENDGELVLRVMKWGIVSNKFRNAPMVINARHDSLNPTKPMYKPLVNHCRCVVPMNGYFEWLNTKDSKKQPYKVHQPDESSLLFMAALYQRAEDPATKEVEYSYAIVTTAAADGIQWLHNRMPLALKTAEQIEEWCNPKVAFEKVSGFLDNTNNGLKCEAVSTFVSRIGNNTEECISPIDLDAKKEEDSKGKITSFFQKTPIKGDSQPVKTEKSGSPPPKQTTLEQVIGASPKKCSPAKSKGKSQAVSPRVKRERAGQSVTSPRKAAKRSK